MIISAVSQFTNSKIKFKNKNQHNKIQNASYSNKSCINQTKFDSVSFGLNVTEFPFDKKTLDFIIPNKTLRGIKPNVEKLITHIDVPTKEGINLKSWFIEPKGHKPVFYFLDGTGYNKTFQQEVAKFFNNNGYGALMIDYRGFGETLGIATEQTLYEDAAAGLQFLNEKGLRDENLVLWGFSMGGAIARKIATFNEFKCGIIDSAIKHEYAIKQHFLNSGIALESELNQHSLNELRKKMATGENIPFDTSENIKNIKYPLLFLHSKGDNIVPYTMTEEQFKLSQNKNSKLIISQGQDPHLYRKWTFDYIKDFVDSIK